MKKILSIVLSVLFSVVFIASFAVAQDDSFAQEQMAQLRARHAQVMSFQADPPAEVFHSAALARISDREYLYKVLGLPDGEPRYEDSGCTLVIVWTGVNYSEVYPKMSGTSRTPYGIEFTKMGTGWMLSRTARMNRTWVLTIDSYGGVLAAKK